MTHRQHFHPRRSSALPSPLIGPAIVLACLAGVLFAYLLAAWLECGSAQDAAMCALAAVPAPGRLLSRLRTLPLRGCQLCDHGRGPDHLRTCGHPRGAMAPVDQVRSRGGACGPEALLLSFPGL